MWADLDRDRRVGGSRPNRFCNTCNSHPKFYIETTDRRDFGGKLSEWGWGQVLSWKFPEFCSVGGDRPQNVMFARFSPTGNSFTPNHLYRGKAETLVCLLLVCEQEFGRYRPLNGAEKWSRDHHANWKVAYEAKNSLIPKCYASRTTGPIEPNYNWLDVIEIIYQIQNDGKLYAGVHIDLQKAFDAVKCLLLACLPKLHLCICHAGLLRIASTST